MNQVYELAYDEMGIERLFLVVYLCLDGVYGWVIYDKSDKILI